MLDRLYIMPTHQCNSKCVYCYIPDEEKQKSGNDKLILENTRQFISSLKAQESNNSFPQIRFIGGEPYLKDSLIREISEMFLPSFKNGWVVINTNGTLINDEMVELYKEDYISRITHIISLDGIQPVHDKRRMLLNGEGTFKKVVNGIKTLQKKKMPVYINMVLDPFSFEHIEDFLVYMTRELKIHELSVSLLNNPDLAISEPKEQFDLLKKVYHLTAKYPVTISGHHRLLLGRKIPDLKCKAGEKSILLTCDGNINGCQRFVGRTSEPYALDQAMKNKNTHIMNMVETHCYSDEAVDLGNRLYEFYEKEYPYYLKINDLDKIVFGVI